MLARRSFGNTTITNVSASGTDTDTAKAGLRVLFFGSDEFSLYSLRAIHQAVGKRLDADKLAGIVTDKEDAVSISHLEVVCPPDRRGGRGKKTLIATPVKKYAMEHGLVTVSLCAFVNLV